jgi:hypothetical protein
MTSNALLADTLDYLATRIDSVSTLADELRSLAVEIELNNIDKGYYSYGTIVKAKPDQSRFKLKSMWVSLGDGTYKHLTGKKGLITKHDRLADYTDVVFQA